MKVKKDLISINISLGSYEEILDDLIDLAKARQSSYVCFANVHMLIEAYNDSDFSKVVKQADFVTADGMPIAKALQLVYGIKQDRVAGMDALPDLLKRAEIENIPVFFYGGSDVMLEQTRSYCAKGFPLLSVAGTYSPPFGDITREEEQDIINIINQSNAQLVFVVLGCPKQEKWMYKMKGQINACMLGIGGALPVMIGMQKRAPLWMQKSGMEWFFRLAKEPRRLFKRYFYTNSLFIMLLAKEIIKKKIIKKDQ